MNITFKFLLNKRRPNALGTYPLILRVYQGVSYKEHSLNFRLNEADWDETKQQVLTSEPNHEIYNLKLDADRASLRKLILLSELQQDAELSPATLIAALQPKKAHLPQPKANSIIQYGESLIKRMTDSGKVGNAFVYSCAINKLKSLVKGRRFNFEDLTYKKLNEFTGVMLADGIKVNTISVYMRTLRAVYNQAIKEGITPPDSYPFKLYRIKNERTINRALTLDELKAIATIDLRADSIPWHWRNYFLLSFCLIGVNFADMLTLKGSNIVDGRIIFRRKKTAKVYSIKITDTTATILRHYIDISRLDDQQLLLPVLKQTTDPVRLKKDIWQAIKSCNYHLRKLAADCTIKKPVTTYFARYSFAGIAKGLGYSKDMIAEALGHEYGNRVTGIYLDNYDNKTIDGMVEVVQRATLGANEGKAAQG